jgi:hypothetical protein
MRKCRIDSSSWSQKGQAFGCDKPRLASLAESPEQHELQKELQNQQNTRDYIPSTYLDSLLTNLTSKKPERGEEYLKKTGLRAKAPRRCNMNYIAKDT